MDNKEQPSVVTKEKHPGRVAQGHKLAALMKKRKEELKQNSMSEQQTEQSSEQLTEPQSQTSTVVYSGAALAIVVVIGVALYVYRKKPAPPSNPAAVQDPVGHEVQHDIFCMR